MAPASPSTRSIFWLSWKVFDAPCSSRPSKRIRPLWSFAEIQLRPSAAVIFTVTLFGGAAAIALSDGSGLGSVGFLVVWLGFGVAALLVEGVDPSAACCLSLSSPPLN